MQPETPLEAPKTTISTILALPKRRKLNAHDLIAVAQLIIRLKCTERAACLHLDIHPDQFSVWKCRGNHREKFEGLLARAKEAKIAGLLENIDECGRGIGMKQRDWRASAWIAERVAPERFYLQNQSQSASQQPQVVVNVLMDTIAKMLPSSPTKQIENQPTIGANKE